MTISPSIDLRTICKPIPYTNDITCDLKHFRFELESNHVDFDPPYQRGPKWTLEQKEAFMGHLLSGGEVLPMIFQRVPDSGEAEILDGKQRALAILDWLNGEIVARLLDGRTIHVSQVKSGLGFINVRIRYVDLPFEERKAFYVKLNSAGTPHTPEELRAALAAKPKKREDHE